MCYLKTETDKAYVKLAVIALIDEGRPFTGHDVYCAMRTAGVFVEFNTMPTASKAISSYVRELFNTGEMPGWASTQVIPKQGPLLFFKVTSSMTAGKVVKQIRDRIEEGEARITAQDRCSLGDHSGEGTQRTVSC
jgi:hypothetical protein